MSRVLSHTWKSTEEIDTRNRRARDREAPHQDALRQDYRMETSPARQTHTQKNMPSVLSITLVPFLVSHISKLFLWDKVRLGIRSSLEVWHRLWS